MGLLSVAVAGDGWAWTDRVAEGAAARPVVCKSKHDNLEPFVPDPATARGIFLAVETAKVPNANRSTFPLIGVFDRGDRWVVFRYRAGVLGGGQLELEIAKCSGRVYRASFGR
jgi:hypothetical protein